MKPLVFQMMENKTFSLKEAVYVDCLECLLLHGFDKNVKIFDIQYRALFNFL